MPDPSLFDDIQTKKKPSLKKRFMVGYVKFWLGMWVLILGLFTVYLAAEGGKDISALLIVVPLFLLSILPLWLINPKGWTIACMFFTLLCGLFVSIIYVGDRIEIQDIVCAICFPLSLSCIILLQTRALKGHYRMKRSSLN
jgi:hypothetical protein